MAASSQLITNKHRVISYRTIIFVNNAVKTSNQIFTVVFFRREAVQIMVKRLQAARQGLRERLKRLGTPGSWDHITRQTGMFSFTGLTSEYRAVTLLETDKDRCSYSVKFGRIELFIHNGSKYTFRTHVKGKGKSIPVEVRTGPEGSCLLRLPDFMTVGIRRW